MPETFERWLGSGGSVRSDGALCAVAQAEQEEDGQDGCSTEGGEREAQGYGSGEGAEQVLRITGIGVLVMIEEKQEGDRQCDQEDGQAGKD